MPQQEGHRLRLSDVRRVFRLVAEIRKRGHDPGLWRPYMLRKLVRFFDAELAISSEIYVRPTSEAGVWEIVDLGWGADASGNSWRIENRARERDPGTYDLLIRPEPPTDPDMVPIAPRKKMYGGSTFILSHMPLPHASVVDQLGLHRAHGVPPFSHEHHRLVRLLHVELGRFWKEELLDRTADQAQALAPRMKQTLDALVDGKSEKEIAQLLGISPHTVHNYVKALHQRFNVSSRGELVAAVNKRGRDFVPRLSSEVGTVARKRQTPVNRVDRRKRPK
jgi:DNA-binding CsgD family transcriptional regulator